VSVESSAHSAHIYQNILRHFNLRQKMSNHGAVVDPRESVVKHLGTSMLATEVAKVATVRERVREVARQQSAVAAFRAGATPVQQRVGHSMVPPSLQLGPPPTPFLEVIGSLPGRTSRCVVCDGDSHKPKARILRIVDAGHRVAGSQRHARPPPTRGGRAGASGDLWRTLARGLKFCMSHRG
jgi:hypothetical protein